MLPLPKSLVITRAPEAEKSLLTHTRTWIEKEERDPRIHVSDLLDPRQAYWNRVNPQPVSNRLATIFLIGKVLHAFVLSAVDGAKGTDWSTDEGSVYDKDLDLVWSADKIIKGIPRELKTSRSFLAPTTRKDIENYCEQLLCYMVATKQTQGQLWILLLNTKNQNGQTEPCYRCYTLTISQDDLSSFRTLVKNTRASIQHALKTKNPSQLPLCREFKCGPGNCEHWDLCQPPGRYPLKTRKAWKSTERDLIQIFRKKVT